MERVNPFFEVIRERIKVPFRGELQDTAKDALINGDTGKVIGFVSPDYQLVTNKKVNDLFMEAVGDAFKDFYITDHLNAPGSKWRREIIINDPGYTHEIMPADTIKIKIDLFNAYDTNAGLGFEIAAFRLVCSNGLMGWRKMFGKKFRHLSPDIIDRIRSSFFLNFDGFYENIGTWRQWTQTPYYQINFDNFIDKNTIEEKEEDGKVVPVNPNDTRILTGGQAEDIKYLYPTVMDEFNETETKWGAYNILMAIATHYTKARKGASNVFSKQYIRMLKLAQEFYKGE